MRLVPILLILSGSCATVMAHDPITTKITYSREVVRIFQKRCFECHREGGKAPMSLMKYDDARPWAKAIKEEVLERRMPPWGAVKGFGEFRNDRALTQEEISIIADWVEGGAPEGEPKYLPDRLLLPVPAPAKLAGNRLQVTSSTKLSARSKLIGIEPKGKGPLPSVRVIAEQPDGSIEPLLWLRQYKGEWQTSFAFRKPITVPAGTEIKVEPPNSSFSFVLYEQKQ